MTTCNTCKHWGSDRDLQEVPGVRSCTAVPMYWEVTDWGDKSNDYKRTLKPEYANTKAFVQDGSDYSATLLTLPDFGCVMHQPKEK